MTLTFLGTASGYPSASRYHTSILVAGEGGALLLDCGANVPMFLMQKGANADFLDGIWLSHAHSDHIGGFSNLIQAFWLQKRRRELKVFAPQHLTEFLKQELKERLLFSSLLGFEVHWQAIQEGEAFSCGKLSLNGFSTRHLISLQEKWGQSFPKACFECYGMTWQMEGKQWVYSSDLNAPEDLEKVWVKPVEGLICELAHFSPEMLFHYLKNKPLKRLWLTHYSDNLVDQGVKLRLQALDQGVSAEVKLIKDNEMITI